jgi:nucleoside-diphosphate-sugar epimerase
MPLRRNASASIIGSHRPFHTERAMRIVITGGAGFLGQRLARAILARGSLADSGGYPRDVSEVVLLDVVATPRFDDVRVATIAGDLADPAVVERAVTRDTSSVFHLAAVVSAQAESEFDTGMRVNLDSTRALLERCRTLAKPPKFVFASSLAVFGGPLPDPVPDEAPVMPQSSYGTQKAIGELLVHDLSRRGMIDGRSLRLPTVTVRPGKPNKAASSFASGIVREPLAGVEAICPVPPGTAMWVTSPRTAIDNIVAAHDADGSRFGPLHALNLPGLRVTAGEIVAALARVAGDEVASRVKWQTDPAIERIVSTWPSRFAAARAHSLGLRADADFDSIVRAHAAGE